MRINCFHNINVQVTRYVFSVDVTKNATHKSKKYLPIQNAIYIILNVTVNVAAGVVQPKTAFDPIYVCDTHTEPNRTNVLNTCIRSSGEHGLN